MKGQVNIRTDGNSRMGLGHIVRCISLAHMLKNEFDIHFYSLSMPDSLQKEIQEEGWKVTLIDKESDFITSLQGDEIVVLDGYHFDSSYQKIIKDTGAKLVCIDDYHDQHFYADLVINHAPKISLNDYNGEHYTKYLLGPDYALLRPEFLEPNRNTNRNIRNEIKNLFICFGGSDSKNLTSKIIECLPEDNFNVTAVIGTSYLHRQDLDMVIENRKGLNVEVRSSLGSKEMKEAMLNADLAIVPASGILFEVISVNLPALSGIYINNQHLIYNGFKEMGVFIDVCQFQKDKIKTALKNLGTMDLKQLADNQKQVIDIKSHLRIASEFRKFKS